MEYKYPYTDFNEYNLDWLIVRIKELTEQWAAYKTQMDSDWSEFKTGIEGEWSEVQGEWRLTREAFEELSNYVNSFFDNLDVQQEINHKLDEMAADGTLLSIISNTVVNTTTSATAAWLSEHVDPSTGYVVDNTLSIAGAAADAAETGKHIRNLEFDIPKITGNKRIPFTGAGYIILNGETADVTDVVYNPNYECLALPCSTGDSFVISVDGGQPGRAFGFVALDGTILSVSSASVSPRDYTVTAPDSTAYLVVNNRKSDNPDGYVYSGASLLKDFVKRDHDELEVLKDSFNYGIFNKNSDIFIAKPGYYAGSAGWTANELYNSYYFTADQDIKVYTDNTPLNYYSLSLYRSDTVESGAFIARYRQQDHNMPTKANQLSVSAGQTLVVSILVTDSNFNLYASNAPVLMGDQMVTQVENLIAGSSGSGLIKVDSTSSKHMITMNGVVYDFRHSVDAAINQDCWRFAGVSKNSVDLVSGDIIGVLKESGEDDYMGGVHGDEIVVNFKIYGDGSPIEAGTHYYKKVCVYMYSHLYRVSSPETNVADRYVLIEFTDGKVVISNTFKSVVDNLSIEAAFNSGLIGVFKSPIQMLASNTDVADLTNLPSTWNSGHDNYVYDVYESNAHIKIENIIGRENDNYVGYVHYFSSESPQRIKVYLSTDHGTWNTGHICNGKFSLLIE